MRKNLLFCLIATFLFSFVACDDNDDTVTPDTTVSSDTTSTENIVTPDTTVSSDTTSTENIVTTDTTVSVDVKFYVVFDNIKDSVAVDSATVFKSIELPFDINDYKIINTTINGESVSEKELFETVVTSRLEVKFTTLKIVKQPTLEQLQASNYTAGFGGSYFDFKNMKYYDLDNSDANKYTFVSNISFDQENVIISFESQWASYNYPLYFVGDELYRRTNLYKKAEGEDETSFFGKYVNAKDKDDVIEIKENGVWNETTWEIKDNYIIYVDDFYDYYFDGKNILTLRNYFTKTSDSAPSIDGTSK